MISQDNRFFRDARVCERHQGRVLERIDDLSKGEYGLKVNKDNASQMFAFPSSEQAVRAALIIVLRSNDKHAVERIPNPHSTPKKND